MSTACDAGPRAGEVSGIGPEELRDLGVERDAPFLGEAVWIHAGSMARSACHRDGDGAALAGRRSSSALRRALQALARPKLGSSSSERLKQRRASAGFSA